MTDSTRMNSHQRTFLRNLRNHPHGLPLEEWPCTTVLRRWMRRPRFLMAVRSLTQTFNVQADLLLSGAAARAAMMLQVILSGEGCTGAGVNSRAILANHQQLTVLTRLVRAHHRRLYEKRIKPVKRLLRIAEDADGDDEPLATEELGLTPIDSETGK